MKTNQSNTPSTPFNKALKYLSYKNRSTKEIYDYLKKKDFSEEEIGSAIAKLIEYKFLDDTNFSEIFIRDRQLKGRSKRMISYELKQKGVNKETAEKSLNKAQEDLKTAKEYIEKRMHQFDRLYPDKRKQRIIGRLQSRGYNWDIIKEVLKKFGG
jgi:regulatory protein